MVRQEQPILKDLNVTAVTRDKLYDLTIGSAGSKVLYFTANPNGEAEVVSIMLRQAGSVKKLKWDLDFADLLIKGRVAKGNIVTKYPVKRIELKEKGVSTLKPRKIWFDEVVRRLNVDGRGELLGEFRGDEQILVITQKGILKTLPPTMTLHFDADMVVLEKWNPKKPISVIYFEGEKERYYLKRFLVDQPNREELFVSDHPKTVLELVSTDWRPVAEIAFTKLRGKDLKPNQEIDIENFIAVKGIKALGNMLTAEKVKNIDLKESLPYAEPEPESPEDIEVIGEEVAGEDDDQPTLF